MKRCFALVAALMLILSLAACSAKDPSPAQKPESGRSPSSEPTPEPSSPGSAVPSEPETADDPDPAALEEPPLYFSLGPEGEVKALRAGDTLGGWTLQSYDAVWDEQGDGVPAVYEADFTAPADAPVEMNCTVYLSPMATETQVYFFDVAEEDYGKMPVMEGTTARMWFGASDTAALSALEVLGDGDRRSCRIAVSRYQYSYMGMSAYNLVDILWLELE